ncbi:MAG: hypothetical protein ABII72_02710 [Parcubacteria group bacterium]
MEKRTEQEEERIVLGIIEMPNIDDNLNHDQEGNDLWRKLWPRAKPCFPILNNRTVNHGKTKIEVTGLGRTLNPLGVLAQTRDIVKLFEGLAKKWGLRVEGEVNGKKFGAMALLADRCEEVNAFGLIYARAVHQQQELIPLDLWNRGQRIFFPGTLWYRGEALFAPIIERGTEKGKWTLGLGIIDPLGMYEDFMAL